MSNQQIIENLWDQKDTINFLEDPKAQEAVNSVLNQLDSGSIRVCEKNNGEWHVNQWIKKAILLSFKTKDMSLIKGGPSFGSSDTYWWDKVPSKFSKWSSKDFQNNNFRTVPGSIVRYSAFISPEALI